jgi:hypothetical protein
MTLLKIDIGPEGERQLSAECRIFDDYHRRGVDALLRELTELAARQAKRSGETAGRSAATADDRRCADSDAALSSALGALRKLRHT